MSSLCSVSVFSSVKGAGGELKPLTLHGFQIHSEQASSIRIHTSSPKATTLKGKYIYLDIQVLVFVKKNRFSLLYSHTSYIPASVRSLL